VSESVLDAVARALQLNDLERTHLFTLAKPSRSRPRPFPPQHVRPGLQLVVDSMTEVPVLVLGRRLDVLAANSLAQALLHRLRRVAPTFPQHGPADLSARPCALALYELAHSGPRHRRQPAPLRRPLPP
jgi:hypothetical protein